LDGGEGGKALSREDFGDASMDVEIAPPVDGGKVAADALDCGAWVELMVEQESKAVMLGGALGKGGEARVKGVDGGEVGVRLI
jgi:hypothetical protein